MKHLAKANAVSGLAGGLRLAPVASFDAELGKCACAVGAGAFPVCKTLQTHSLPETGRPHLFPITGNMDGA
jgi:hypothetical protein